MVFLPRAQLFEFNDLAAVPRPLRDSIVESLGRATDWGRMLRGVVPPFRAFLAESGATEVLDLCAGSGSPARSLTSELSRQGETSPRFILTDLHPHLEDWAALKAGDSGAIDFIAEPVDATNIPPPIARGRARAVINAFHHFPPELAAAILRDAVTGSRGIFIAEPFDRNPLRFLPLAPVGLPALFANPVLSRRDRREKVFLTWLTPLALAAGVWDGFVSTLRIYTEADLREMVAPFGEAFRWEYGVHEYPPFGRGYYFYGVPKGP